MESLRGKLIISLFCIGFASCALAEDVKPGRSAAPAAPTGKATLPGKAILTGKERLGPKWTDEQRIDNCKVPLDKRGAKPRPSLCQNAPPS